jgi:hypothetical protein
MKAVMAETIELAVAEEGKRNLAFYHAEKQKRETEREEKEPYDGP